jgi:2,3-bisphosphoglycerate-independent phosphoglycerate mutase
MKEFIKTKKKSTKMILLVFGGLGGVQSGPNLLTELQQAHSPNLDAIVRKSICGLWHPLGQGLTPGPLVSLLSLLGYDVAGLIAKEKQLRPLYNQLAENPAVLEDIFNLVHLTPFDKKFELNPVLLSNNPRVKLICSGLGFQIIENETDKPEALLELLIEKNPQHDFIFIYIDETNRYGQNGEYYEKIKTIEKIDPKLPQLNKIQHDVLAITGDHSTPTEMLENSWHPLPVLIQSRWCRYDTIQSFDEVNCALGGLGFIKSSELMTLLMANAHRLDTIGP